MPNDKAYPLGGSEEEFNHFLIQMHNEQKTRDGRGKFSKKVSTYIFIYV